MRKRRHCDSYTYVGLLLDILANNSYTDALPASTQADAVLTRDLAIRQDTIENCAENYTTKNGLAFKLYCQQNAPLSGEHQNVSCLSTGSLADRR